MDNTIERHVSLTELCQKLSISEATGRNWLRLNKISATAVSHGKPMFSEEYVESLLLNIQSKEYTVLKSRRNKKQVSGVQVYKDYVATDSRNLEVIGNIIEEVQKDFSLLDFFPLILAEYSIQFLAQTYTIPYGKDKSLLEQYYRNEIDLGGCACLVEDLIKDNELSDKRLLKLVSVLEHTLVFSEGEDLLGLLYISIQNLGDRKAKGAYYTPYFIIRKMLQDIFDNKREWRFKTIMDPCCGTGNFLLSLKQYGIPFSNIYGQDLDYYSVAIARINLAAMYKLNNMEGLYTNITWGNSLKNLTERAYDLIIGNPPWGYSFSKEELFENRSRYETASMKGAESYDLFLENAMQHIVDDGVVAFVLPEAILNIKTHFCIRKMVMEHMSIYSVAYLGNVFHGVQCPAIVLILVKDKGNFTTTGIQVSSAKESFTIRHNRVVSPYYFNFLIRDEEYDILSRVSGQKNITTLKGQADFALGIVTGNNKEFLSETKSLDAEPILKGSNLSKYSIRSCENFITFHPERFQQVASAAYYRAKEKLIYRFICDSLVFAYDDEQTLTLNSCNILIPKIESLSIKYIMAILNSRFAQFYFTKQFNSVKILRSHIEEIPIPLVSTETQASIVEKVELIREVKDRIESIKIYNEIDKEIMGLYMIRPKEEAMIISAVSDKNLFIQ